VPNNISKLFFTSSVNTSSLTASNFNIKYDDVTPKEDNLYYTNVKSNTTSSFMQVTPKSNTHSFALINTNNLYWFVKQGVQNKSSVQSASGKSSINIIAFPNPYTSEFKVSINDKNSLLANAIEVFNIQGARVAIFNNTSKVNITHLAAGVYTYKVLLNNNAYIGKLIKQ
jgi:hypothetical protein